MFEKRNKVVEKHYRENFNKYVKIGANALSNRSEAGEDVTHNAYKKALEYFFCFNPELRSFNTWFNTIFKHCIADFRNEERGLVSEDNMARVPIVEGFSDEIKKEIKLFIDKNYKNLYYNGKLKPEPEVLSLYYFTGLSPKEISYLIEDMTEANVRQIISRFSRTFVQVMR